MRILWQSDAITDGRDRVTVLVRGQVVVLVHDCARRPQFDALTAQQARAKATAHMAIAEALANAANRLEQDLHAEVQA